MDFQNIADMFLVNKNNHRPMAKGDAGHMKKYVSAYEQGTYLMLEFEKVDSVTGDLSLVDDDITVIMPSDQITGRPYDLRYRAQKTGGRILCESDIHRQCKKDRLCQPSGGEDGEAAGD